MTKILKIVGRTLGIGFEWLLIFVIVFAFLIRSTAFQTYLAQKATAYLSKELKSEITIERIEIVFLDKLSLNGVKVIDQSGKKLLETNEILVTIDKLDIAKNSFVISKAILDKGSAWVYRSKKDGEFNFQYFIDYFASDEPTSKGKPLILKFLSVKMNDFNLKYDDFRNEPVAYGLDYSHLDLKRFHLDAKDFNIENDDIAFQLNNLTFKEQCGFESKQFKAGILISPKQGIKLSKFSLKTPESNLYFPRLNLLFSSFDAFSAFEDSIEFDVAINPSVLSLKDVSYFATSLEGMTDRIRLSGEIKNPLKKLNINNLDLRVGNKTFLKGNIALPDFRDGNAAPFSAYLWKGHVSLEDLERFHLPKGTANLKFEAPVSNLGSLDITNLSFQGSIEKMKVKVASLKTNIGEVRLLQSIQIDNKNNQIAFAPISKDSMAVKVVDFNLGSFLDNTELGLVSGDLKLNGDVNEKGAIALHNMYANLRRFDFNDYAYANVSLQKGELVNDNLFADLQIKDPNVDLEYSGNISIGEKQKYNFDLNLDFANLGKLNFSEDETSKISTSITGNLSGETFENISGTIQANFLQYEEGGDELNIPVVNIAMQRQKDYDKFSINSSIIAVNLEGKIDYNTVLDDFLEDLALVLPSLNVAKKDLNKQRKLSDFSFQITTGVLDEFLTIFVPDLKIEQGTILKGKYNSVDQVLTADLKSGFVKYQDIVMDDINIVQSITKAGILGDYKVSKLTYDDSLSFDKIRFETEGKNGILNSKLSWNPETENYSSILWETLILEDNQLNFSIQPSFFSLNGLRWEIANKSEIALNSEDLLVSNFKLIRNKQFIKVNGCLSNNNNDKLRIDIQKFDLGELSQILGLDINMKGIFSSWGELSNPYTNLRFGGSSLVENFTLNDQEVGKIGFSADWNAKSESLSIKDGSLNYKNQQTFDFNGIYALKTNDLNFDLNFNKTDIQFANAFMDPEVVKDIQGKLNGSISVKGKVESPKLTGDLNLEEASAQVELLGVKYRMNGHVVIKEDIFELNNLPVKDEDGNTASLVGSVLHDNFTDWNLDLQFNFEDDFSKKILPNGQAVPLEKFMLLKTKYKDGDVYFGKAYGRGTANISGSASNLDVTVDVETKKGTLINFPMYGVSDIDESEDFVQFVQKGNLNKQFEDKIDFSGINLDLKFRVNPDAQMKIIFNEQINDEILASGSGIIEMRLDQYNNVTLNGDYVIGEGSVYNFALGPIKQPFNIESGSKISWTGDALNAGIDIKTSVPIKKVSILELSPEQMDKTLASQDVMCYLNLTETLLKPTISFDIKAPRAPETGKTLIARVTNDPDELNRQFFSLLLVRKFQPLKGSVTAGGSAALDLLESQINTALGSLSDKYKLNVDYGADETLGEKSLGVGLKTGFLNDRLIVSGSFGVENKTASASTSGESSSKGTSSLIGDVNVEYLVNEKGTFRVNAFNKSNTNSVKENLGPFTQGAGLSYREDFNSAKDFELWQYTLDLFRRKDKRYHKKRQTKVPPLEATPTQPIKTEEKE